MFKELRSCVIAVGVLLAIVNGLRVYIMYDQDIMLAVSIGITMIGIVCDGKMYWLYTYRCVAKKIGLDPALMAAPLDFYDYGYLYDFVCDFAIITSYIDVEEE